MKKYLMAAVALFCLTMTCVTLTSCGDDDSPSSPVECTIVADIDFIESGSLSEVDELSVKAFALRLNGTQVYAAESDAKSKLNALANELAENIKSNGWNASGAVYTYNISLQNPSGKTLATTKVIVNNGSVTVN